MRRLRIDIIDVVQRTPFRDAAPSYSSGFGFWFPRERLFLQQLTPASLKPRKKIQFVELNKNISHKDRTSEVSPKTKVDVLVLKREC